MADGASARKADYYFMEAMRQRALEREDLAHAMLARALELTPDKTGREAYEVGTRLMMMANTAGDSLAFARAMELTDSYFRAHPSDVYAGSLLGSINVQTGKLDRALEIYNILEEVKPNNVSIAAAHADVLLALKRFDEAEALYRRLEKTMGRNPALTQRISNVQIWQGDTLGALNEVDDLILAQPRSIDALHLGAAACLQFGRPERALDYVARARELDPTNGTTYYYASQAYKALNRPEEYAEAITGAITGDELDLSAKLDLLRYYLSEELNGKEDYAAVADRFVPLFESIVRQYPHDYQTRIVYMSFLIALRRWADAAEQMAYAIDADPSNVKDYVTLARLYTSADKPAALALGAIDEGLRVHPAQVELHEFKAALLSGDGRPQEAVDVLRRALAIDSISRSEQSDIYRDIADMEQKIPADSAKVSADYEKALELNPENDLAMNNYAYWLSTSGGDLLRAKELIAKAVVYNPGSATYYDTYAWVCFRLGDLEEAKRYIDMALLFDRSEQENAPEQMVELLDHAAEIYSRLGQADKADDYRRRAQELQSLK